MVYKKLYFHVIIRVLLISITCFFFNYELIKSDHTFTLINLGILIVIQIILLIHYLNKTNKNLTAFFNSIKSGDQIDILTEHSNFKSLKELNQCINIINKSIQKVKIENQVQWEYFQIVVEHVGVGIISFDQKGKIDLYNAAAKQIFNIKILNNINQLEIQLPNLYSKIKALKVGETDTIKISSNNSMKEYVLSTTSSYFNEKHITIISLQDIAKPLDIREIESYQKLIRILTHEIMNSVAPISSLSGSISKNMKSYKHESVETDQDFFNKTIEGIEIIEKRSKGLANFVSRFREVSVLKPIEIEKVKIEKLFKNILPLFQSKFENQGIDLKIDLDSEIEIFVDVTHIEQVLINLIKNAIEAFDNKENKSISIHTIKESNHAIIKISDTGMGIEEKNLENIFVPFYTTKNGGSGIGLSFSKQVLLMHGGNIEVNSKLNEGTTFKLIF